jgi:hypothetical protein
VTVVTNHMRGAVGEAALPRRSRTRHVGLPSEG